MKNLVLLTLCIGLWISAGAQISRVPGNLFFLIGTWQGNGQFTNGKKIEATIRIDLALDSSWLLVQHTDKPPGKYKAISFWGVDIKSGRFLAFTIDNYLGHRNFVTNGWKKGKLDLKYHEASPQQEQTYQHLIYEKITDNSFRMRYEISNGKNKWPLIDSLVFTRN